MPQGIPLSSTVADLPRCESCKHWERSMDPNAGDCLRMSAELPREFADGSERVDRADVPVMAWARIGPIVTTARFGCVLYEP